MKPNSVNRLERLDLNKLPTFLAVMDAGGVSAAARGLGLTRSAVSQSIATLEAQLDTPLFDRVGRRLAPTAEGRRLAERARGALDGLALAVDDALDEQGPLRGRVRLGVFVGAARDRLARFVAGFLEAHPEVEVRLRHASLSELRGELARGSIDFALGLIQSPQAGAQVVSTHLYDQTLELVSGRRPARGVCTPERLARLRAVDYTRSAPLIARWTEHHFGPHATVPRVTAWAHDTELVLELIRSGVGVGVVPRGVADPLIRAGELFVVRGPGSALLDPVFLDEPRGAHRGRTLRAFRDAMRSELGAS